MLMMSSYPSFASRLTETVIATALFSSVLWMTTADAGPLSIAPPGARALPESITSARDGTLFIGRLGDGGIIRANPRTGKASLFVAPGASGSRSITGVFADEASKTLWACSNDLSALGGPSGGRDRGSALKGFDLRTGTPKLSVPLPGRNAFCNGLVGGARSSGAISEHQGCRSFGFQGCKDASCCMAVEFRIGHAHLSLCEGKTERVRRSATATIALHES
jgi:hypothetical protein